MASSDSKIFLRIGYALAPIALIIGVAWPIMLLLLLTPGGVRLIMHFGQACAEDTLGDAVEYVNEVLEKRNPMLTACLVTGREQQKMSGPDLSYRIGVCTKKPDIMRDTLNISQIVRSCGLQD